MEITVPMQDPIDREAIASLSRKMHKEFDNLSDDAKTFITDNLIEGHNNIYVLDYILNNYKAIIKDRFYSDDSDEDDALIIRNLQFLIQLFEIYLE